MADTSRKSLQRPLLYALVLVAAYLTYLILSPFLVALTWAVLLAILFRRVQVALSPRLGESFAALATTLCAGVVIVAPAAMLVSALAQEVPQVAGYVRQAPAQIERAWDALRVRSPVALPEDSSEFLSEGTRRALMFLAPRAGAIVADLFATLGSLIAMLFALFFLLRDGDAMLHQLRERLPLPRDESERLIRDTHDLVVASVGAGFIVSATQGLIGGLAFWLLGLGAPVFWGVVMAVCSLLPVVGAALVWVPAGIGLLLSGRIGEGVGMLVIGALGISMADNILRPLLLSGRTSVNGLVIFFGLLGGAAAFGFVGIVIGPIILVITDNLLEALRRRDREDARGI